MKDRLVGDRRAPDRVSGSVDLLEEALGTLRAHLDRRGLAGLSDLLGALAAEHPSMALRIRLAVDLEELLPAGLAAVRAGLEAFAMDLARERVAVAARFASLVEAEGWKAVATYSRSGQVREALATAREAGLKEVVLSEARPAGEGLLMARELRGEGLAVTLTADAALPSLLGRVQAAVVGADATFEGGFANKVGTGFLLREARALDLPAVVLALPQKALDGESAARWVNLPLDPPAGMGRLRGGVRWAGELFEIVPWDLATHALGR